MTASPDHPLASGPPLADRLRDGARRSANLRQAAVAYRRLLVGTAVTLAAFGLVAAIGPQRPQRPHQTGLGAMISVVLLWTLAGLLIVVSVQVAQTSRGVGDRPLVATLLTMLSVILGTAGIVVVLMQVARVRRLFLRSGHPLPPLGWGSRTTDMLPEHVSLEAASPFCRGGGRPSAEDTVGSTHR